VIEDGPVAQPTIPATAILPLRLFLGATFVYAGIQKLTDPGFFSPTAGTYIGKQILAFSRGSPIAFLLHPLADQAPLIGALTIVTEVAIGMLVLLGLGTRLAALTGLVLNFVFFLSASWHTYPYFMGSDIVFVVAWLTLALTGPGPYAMDPVVQPALSRALRLQLGAGLGPLVQRLAVGPPAEVNRDRAAGEASVISRREALVGGLVGLVLIALGLVSRSSTVGGGAVALPKPSGSAATPPTPGTSAAPTSGSRAIPAGARKIGNISQLPVNSSGMVADPQSGDPAIVIHTAGNQFVAYDAVCTHAGCTVDYDPSSRLIVCPCHGAQYDPAHDAQVVGGPAPSPLAKLKLTVDPRGNLYLV
jgi:thiosulfate dehydrogenase [quinone] large subunit